MHTPRLLKSFAMPVDPAAFAGVPSVTALKPLPGARVLLAAAMDRRVVMQDGRIITDDGQAGREGTVPR